MPMATNIFDQFLYWRFPSTAEAGSPRAFLWLVVPAIRVLHRRIIQALRIRRTVRQMIRRGIDGLFF